MNEPVVVEMVELARKTGVACRKHFAPYEVKEASGTLKLSDITKYDAVWMIAIAKPPKHLSKLLKRIAKGHEILPFVE